MQPFNLSKPLRAKAIYLRGRQQPLIDCFIWFAGNFLVVAADENDTEPTWYNVEMVCKMVGVEALPAESRQARISFF